MWTERTVTSSKYTTEDTIAVGLLERDLMYGMYFASELALKHLLKKLALKALINKSHICNDTVYFELRLQETFFFNG